MTFTETLAPAPAVPPAQKLELSQLTNLLESVELEVPLTRPRFKLLCSERILSGVTRSLKHA